MRDHEPTVRSRELGLALKRAAHAKGLRGTAVARRLGWSSSRVSRLYSGKRASENSYDVAAILAICDITGPKRDELLRLSRHAWEPGWWQDYGDRLPPEIRTLSNFEDAAIATTNFQTSLVPGLLQTEAYCRARLEKSPYIPKDEVDERVAARMERQQIFDRPFVAKFVFFLDEYLLLRTGPGAEIMSEQLHHLLRASVRPNVEIRVIPDERGFHAGYLPFQVMEFTEFHPVVCLENQTSALFLERKDTVASYRLIVQDLDAVALGAWQSREWLRGLATALSEEHDDPSPPLEEEFPDQHR